ncbi:Arc family DNA-binding protein [Massilia genomosp. 1]|uniref:Arc family DNA-binding protein n=1 Tax=Massilia genomosp. 1 TaxID=2609280 RepID=A0ABX0MIP7_9BURK|nr:Arc family DNA-binding protein [Massilia genomosp. 1]NHZ62641.1 Arc family DNA-binding protein [Massilia genomosp. 1]
MTTAIDQATCAKEQFILRFPAGMRAQLKNIAAANRRSLNAELLLMIERGLAVACAPQSTLQPKRGNDVLNLKKENMA